MVPEIEKPRVTEIQVRMDCNGCVHKVKKALSGISGIYDLQIDLAQQKIIMVGWADPEKVVKAIKKTRKVATICSHTEVPSPPAPAAEPTPDGGAPPPKDPTPPPAEAPPADAQPAPVAAEPPKDPQPAPAPAAAEPPKDQPPPPPENPPAENKDTKSTSVVYHHPPEYGYRYGYAHSYGPAYSHGYIGHPGGPSFRYEQPPPVYMMHSYNTYQPSSYITGYRYIESPPMSGMETYYEGEYMSGNSSKNITSVFSDENPNACIIS